MADASDPRMRLENDAPVRGKRGYVLYWMTEARRTRWNRALARAVTLAKSMGRPLLVFEALRCDYRYASARFHRFVLDGMADQTVRFEAAGIAYYPYVEPVPGAGKGLLEALAADACVVVTDAGAFSFLPRMRAAAAKRLDVRLESVDGSGLLPRAAIRENLDDPFAFLKRFRQTLPKFVFQGAVADPLAEPPRRTLERLPKDIADRWHPTRKALIDGDLEMLAHLPIDGTVAPTKRRGGELAARETWAAAMKLPPQRFEADVDGYLHYGHLSIEQLAQELLLREGRIASVDLKPSDEALDGWWRTPPAIDRFLDRAVVRREHAHHRAERRGRDGDRFDNLPHDARRVFEDEAGRPGRATADIAALEAGQGPDAEWNALQLRLRAEGVITPGLRRRWAGGLVDQAATPRDAFDLAVHLTNKYALDGRDPFALAEAASVFRLAPPPRPPQRDARGKGGSPAGKGGIATSKRGRRPRGRGPRGKGPDGVREARPPQGPTPPATPSAPNSDAPSAS